MKAFVIVDDRGAVVDTFVGNGDEFPADALRDYDDRLKAIGLKLWVLRSESASLLPQYVTDEEAEARS